MLPLCSLLCPVTICHGDKQHYVVCVSSACDPIVLENAEAVEQLTKQMYTDSEDVGETITWITMHLPSDFLQVFSLYHSSSFMRYLTKNAAQFSILQKNKNIIFKIVRHFSFLLSFLLSSPFSLVKYVVKLF